MARSPAGSSATPAGLLCELHHVAPSMVGVALSNPVPMAAAKAGNMSHNTSATRTGSPRCRLVKPHNGATRTAPRAFHLRHPGGDEAMMPMSVELLQGDLRPVTLACDDPPRRCQPRTPGDDVCGLHSPLHGTIGAAIMGYTLAAGQTGTPIRFPIARWRTSPPPASRTGRTTRRRRAEQCAPLTRPSGKPGVARARLRWCASSTPQVTV